MAEVLGAMASGITLAALFKACVEAFELIQASRHQDFDFKKLKLRLNIEKCRLYIWGESMGLTDATETSQKCRIDSFRFPDTVREILEILCQLFHDSQKIRDKYGCREATAQDVLEIEPQGPASNLAASFSKFSVLVHRLPKADQSVKRVTWIIQDRKKFAMLVVEIKDLIDSLRGITSPLVPVARHEVTMRRKVAKIQDPETLSLVAEVCSEDHPDIANVASTKADTISSGSSNRHNITAWAECVQDARDDAADRFSPDIESLTTTELKHKLLEMIHERREHKTAPVASNDGVFRAANLMMRSQTTLDQKSRSSGSIDAGPTNQENELNRSQAVRQSILDAKRPTAWRPQGCSGLAPKCLEMQKSTVISRYDTRRSSESFPISDPGTPTMHSTNENFSSHEFSNSGCRHPPGPFTLPPIAALLENIPSPPPLNNPDFPDNYKYNLESTARASPIECESCHRQDTGSSTGYLMGKPAGHRGLSSTSSLSSFATSYSTSSRYGQPYNAGSLSCSVDDPADSSSVVSDASFRDTGPKSQNPFSVHGVTSSTHPSLYDAPAITKKHKCTFCDKQFTRLTSLQTHMYSHSGEKPFVCEVEDCGRRFSVFSNLRRHQRIHKEDNRDKKDREE